ncbi:AfsR/SARP family transcriptional regulator, partial [Nonomuraea longicatena]|uniref:AfsR/SARP family transcriptional regulator n=1 Tax=Nonomuraea longicatena TaxID=83682 RepID=UPI0031D12985
MRISILGPLEVRSAAGPVHVGGSRVRALLVLLALEAGRPVTGERLIDALWADDPPANAANALQTLVKRLRATLRPNLRVDGVPGGYLLPIEPEAVDAREFTALAARRDADSLERALALWRGPALADLRAVPRLAAVATALDDERLVALEAYAQAVLALPAEPGRTAGLAATSA